MQRLIVNGAAVELDFMWKGSNQSQPAIMLRKSDGIFRYMNGQEVKDSSHLEIVPKQMRDMADEIRQSREHPPTAVAVAEEAPADDDRFLRLESEVDQIKCGLIELKELVLLKSPVTDRTSDFIFKYPCGHCAAGFDNPLKRMHHRRQIHGIVVERKKRKKRAKSSSSGDS